MFRNVLAAIDGSPHGERALAEALDIAQGFGARLTIVTVVPDPSAWILTGGVYGGAIDHQALMAETEREYQQLLDASVASVPSDVSVTSRLMHGRPGDRILEQFKEGRHDLVVMGSRGRGNVRSLLLGSVSHQVLNAAPGATLIVHAETEPEPSS